ncbi:MAG: SIS domain-containing protein [Candidatus Eremiobacteraeota bacterium]|nr:SIS domain-containing protein [Candidatus Eremiobacteraeota bacterium]
MSRRLGLYFEREIREQPELWERLAATGSAERLARCLNGDVVLVGSGSSLFVAQLGALALRRRGVNAQALAATEARLDYNAYQNRIVVAISQSGRSTDLLDAVDVLRPRSLLALTNTIDSPLAARATHLIDIGAGPELAVPASKSVSTSAAIVLWAASLLAGDGRRDAAVLLGTAREVATWLHHSAAADVLEAAQHIALSSSVVVLGSDYGLPIALEIGLKFKEACYLHAEGFAAGEFRHGSIAMVDASCAVIGILDDDAYDIVTRPLGEVASSGAARFTLGARAMSGVPRLGPDVDVPFNTLAWLVTAQLLALHIARTRHIDSDAPRGLKKALVSGGT